MTGPEVVEFAAVRVQLGWGEAREQPVHDGAEAVLVRHDGLFVEVHYRFPAGAPIIPRRVGLALYGSQIAGARHFGSVWAFDQAWHVVLETDQE